MKFAGNIDKLGIIGLVVIVLFSPCCFPLFMFAATALGLGGFELLGGWTMWLFQAMVVISLAGLFISYRRHRSVYPLLIAIPAAVLIFYGYYFGSNDYLTYFLYAGMFWLLAATGVNYYRGRLPRSCRDCYPQGKGSKLHSVITCPNCGHKKEEIMPDDTCVYFYECENCGSHLKPLEGDCCVYCSYGSVKCPPVQADQELKQKRIL